MPTIYVSRNGNSMQLNLSDSEGHNPGNDNLTTDVSPGDTVQWELNPNGSGLTSIVSISKTAPTDPSFNPSSIDLLVSNPTSNGGVFTGVVVSPSPGRGTFENYKIGFTVPGDPTTYYDDPKLQMNA